MRELHAVMRRPGPKFELNEEEREFLGPTDVNEMLAELDKPETPHKRRLLIGERLDVLGDPRQGIGVDADGTSEIDWRSVPGGKVTISILSDPNDSRSVEKEKRCTRVKPFHTARYPVTVVQYRAFIAAEDGWRDPAWWGEDLYRDEDGNTYEFGRFGNYPAVYVSWFDAMAFCRWLSRRLGFTVRLPDEWEWQQAATGGDTDNVFPWGPNWNPKQEPWRANTFESRLGQPTAVGMYPAGVSPAGVLDMAGTVWEWCLNLFEQPDETEFSASSDPRVLRGGAWDINQKLACAANRSRDYPSSRLIHYGFRVVCSSPSTGH